MRQNLREEQLTSFNPNGPGNPGNLFGLPFNDESSELVIVPMPWEATVSYGYGTAKGPQSILEASVQVDLDDYEIYEPWSMGIHMNPIPEDLIRESDKYRDLAASYIHWLESGELITESMKVIPNAVDDMMEKVHIYSKSAALKYLENNQIVGVLGGDHSTPLGLIQAIASRTPSFGILQIDAHADLRKGYEDFRYSHASIMYNALQLSSVERLVQVGIRDICQEELQRIDSAQGRIKTYFDDALQKERYEGTTWHEQCEEIINALPQDVYVSFDIDGLTPALCPGTGTPVPGGLTLNDVRHMLRVLVKSGRKIVGFDLCEVAPGSTEWDANVGARALYLLCMYTGVSQGLLKFR